MSYLQAWMGLCACGVVQRDTDRVSRCLCVEEAVSGGILNCGECSMP